MWEPAGMLPPMWHCRIANLGSVVSRDAVLSSRRHRSTVAQSPKRQTGWEADMAEFVTICEVGPRDGLQIAKGIMPTPVKTLWIAAIAAAGVPQIEVGSFVPPKLIPQMADTPEIVRRAVLLPNVAVQALAPNLRGAQAAYAAGAHRISIPASVSEGHTRSNLNRSPAEQVAEVGRMVAWLRAQRRKVQIAAACSTAVGCSIDGVVPIDAVVRVAAGLAQAGADAVSLAHTVGYRHPAQIPASVRP